MIDSSDDRGPLAREIDQLAFECRLRNGKEATHILLPRKSRSTIKDFVEALCAEIAGIGSPPMVFDRFLSGVPATFRELHIVLYDGDELMVGGEEYL